MTTLISFYTNDWNYPFYAQKLAADCRKIEMPYKIEQLASTGSYLKNTCLKPQFILDKLLELKSPVLWVDVDGSILRRTLILCQLSMFDFAARRMSEARSRTWHVGTMWFNHTPKAILFLQKWIENTGNLSDESALEKTWQDHGGDLQTFDLPKEYFHIYRKGQKIPKETIVMHRISDGPSKKKEMSLAAEKSSRGEY